MNFILSHPTGNANVRAVANGLFDAGVLFAFHTSIASFPGSVIDKLGAFKPLSEIRRRRFDTKLRLLTETWPWLKLGALLASKLGMDALEAHETGMFSADSIFMNFDRHVASKLKNSLKKGADGVYAYEDCALATFTLAKSIGMKCIYDLPIAYWETGRRLMNEEAVRMPEWSRTLGGGIADSEAKLERKVRELELAETVIVPSKFVYDSLPSWANDKKIVIAPFGTPGITGTGTLNPRSGSQRLNGPLRILFVGSLGQRKGLGDLFAAIKILNRSDLELVVMGSLLQPLKFYKEQLPNFIYEHGRSNEQVLELMRTCDVFCLPSIVEGRALVMQEAMSQGLPLIITPNTGGEDLIIEGKTGFLVPVRSPEAIAQKISWFLNNRDAIAEMGKLAQAHAIGYTWANYEAKIVGAIKESFFVNDPLLPQMKYNGI